jgi:hypothetical protein
VVDEAGVVQGLVDAMDVMSATMGDGGSGSEGWRRAAMILIFLCLKSM